MDSDLFADPKFCQKFWDADTRFRSTPELLSDTDLQILEKAGNGSARQVRAQARREKAARTEGDDVGVERLFAKYPRQPITLSFLGKMFDQCAIGTAKVFGPILKRLEAENSAFRAENGALRTRMAALEAKFEKGFQISGWGFTYQPGSTYRPGELVQKSGIWVALRETTTQPGSDPQSWRLLVHRKYVKGDDEA